MEELSPEEKKDIKWDILSPEEKRNIEWKKLSPEEQKQQLLQGKSRKTKNPRWQTYTRECLHCRKPFITTSPKRNKVHPECRRAFYLSYNRKRYTQRKIVSSISRISEARKRYFMNNQPCEACGFQALTKIRSFLNEETQKLEEHYLCPNCIALWRCGMLKAFSWEKI